MIAKRPLRANTQAPYPRAMAALVAATLAILIDLIFRFRDYQALLHLLPVAGCVKFPDTLMLVDVPEFLVVGERYGRKRLLVGR